MHWGPGGWRAAPEENARACRKRKALDDAARYVRLARLVEDHDHTTTRPDHVRDILTASPADQRRRFADVVFSADSRAALGALSRVTVWRIVLRTRRRDLP